MCIRDRLRGSIMQLILGSSLLGMSEKNTNSERLVRAHLKLFRDITEADAIDVQDWFNIPEVRTKLAYLFNEPALEKARFEVKPSNYIDIGDIEAYTKMLKDLTLLPTEGFIEKTGLSVEDVTGYENNKNVSERSQATGDVRKKGDGKRGFASMVMDRAKRFFNRNRPGDGEKVGGSSRLHT